MDVGPHSISYALICGTVGIWVNVLKYPRPYAEVNDGNLPGGH